MTAPPSIIPDQIVFCPPSEVAVAMHEAGHAVAAIVLNVVPEFIEIFSGPPPHGRNRIPKVATQKDRQFLAAAGFAVEVALFESGRLIDAAGSPLAEREFIQQALGSNAAIDKIAFFGVNREGIDGCWPKDDDIAFMNVGRAIATSIPLDRVTALADELLSTRKVSTVRIAAIWDSFIVKDLVCERPPDSPKN